MNYLSTFFLFKYKYFPYLKLMIAIGCFNFAITIKVCKFFYFKYYRKYIVIMIYRIHEKKLLTYQLQIVRIFDFTNSNNSSNFNHCNHNIPW